jgi:Rrf2 family protein
VRALSTGEKLAAPEICRREQLPLQFAYRIMKKLEKGGIIVITRGADGGATLSVDLDKITVYQLVEIVDDKQEINACLHPDFCCPRNTVDGKPCAVHEYLSGVQDTIVDMLNTQTLGELLTKERSN